MEFLCHYHPNFATSPLKASAKQKSKSKSGSGSLTKEDAALQPALFKSKSKTKSSAGSLPKEDIALKPALPKSKAKSKSGAGDLAKQDIALRLSLSKSKPKAKSGAGKLPKEDIALQQALDKISASFGKGAIMWLGRQDTPKTVPVVSTGSFALDMALGVGGLPKGRVVEVYGPEASGKTTLALHVIAEAQKQGGVCAFFNAGHALDLGLAEAIGVNTTNLLLSQPDSCEQALSLVDTLARSGSVRVVVVDSVPPVLPEGELDGEMRNLDMAVQARLMSQLLRRLSHSLSLSQTILIFINEVSSHQEVSSLGTALKFYASVRLNMKKIGLVKKAEDVMTCSCYLNTKQCLNNKNRLNRTPKTVFR
ncbi:DNA repair protein recA homolog 3, mitochondrial-like [Papaver somniferum]|uniref:DNA repair protein recA homolog 3, mitochondrial-like n=1 Tax=Papaver somniferum TaxID=3469 RepID=UPI000E700702|nr:DNA repair protein recA homolog 3, mitochondrial-like [Papaver somniferum]